MSALQACCLSGTTGGTTVSGVPYMYRMMRKLGIMKRGMPGLKTMTAAGGKLSFDSLDLIELLVMMEEAIGEDVYDM